MSQIKNVYFSYLDWSVIYRLLETENRHQFHVSALSLRNLVKQKQWNDKQERFSGKISNLEPGKSYLICLAGSEGEVYYIQYDNCREITMDSLPKISPTNVISSSISVLDKKKEPELATVIENKKPSKSSLIAIKRIVFLPLTRQIKLQWDVRKNVIRQEKNYEALPKAAKLEGDKEFPSVHYKIDQGNGGVITFTKYNLDEESRNVEDSKPLNPPKEMSWRITYRQFGSDNETEVVIIENGAVEENRTVKYTVDGLAPGTPYVICFQPVSSSTLIYTKHHDDSNRHCQELMTQEEEIFPATEVAVATTVSTTTTVLVVTLLCCFFPNCFKCGKKKKNAKKNMQHRYVKQQDSPDTERYEVNGDTTDTSSVLNSYQTDMFLNKKHRESKLKESNKLQNGTLTQYVMKNDSGYLTPLEKTRTSSSSYENSPTGNTDDNYKRTIQYIQTNNVSKIKPEGEKYDTKTVQSATTNRIPMGYNLLKTKFGYDVPKGSISLHGLLKKSTPRAPLQVNQEGFYVVPKPSFSCSDIASCAEEDSKSEYSQYFWNPTKANQGNPERRSSERRTRSVSPRKSGRTPISSNQFEDGVNIVHVNGDTFRNKGQDKRAVRTLKTKRKSKEGYTNPAFNTWTSPLSTMKRHRNGDITTSGSIWVETHPGYLVPQPSGRPIPYRAHSYNV